VFQKSAIIKSAKNDVAAVVTRESANRRGFPRFPINELFLVEANSRVKRCILKNVSAGGVCLVIERPYENMANFILRPIGGGNQGWPCRTVWEAGSRLGAQFCYSDSGV